MIRFFEKENFFKIDTTATSYIIGIADGKYAGHAYYGRRLPDDDVSYLMRINEAPFVPSKNGRDKLSFLDCFPMEYPVHGIGDFREDCIAVRNKDGYSGLELLYDGYEITKEKPHLDGLPQTFASDTGASETLKLHLKDEILGFKVTLLYTIFEDSDAVVRSVIMNNESSDPLYITKALSACIDMDNKDFELMTLNGSWARERHIQRNPVGIGFAGVSSVRGETSHQHHPFLGFLSKGADDEHGEVYGMHFIYSGNFKGLVYRGQFDNVRMMMGINDEDFTWKLEPGESFMTPEAVTVYSAAGIGRMTRTYHDLYRNHLIRSPYKDKKRPILINNWEATYFDFNTDKLLDIARESSKLGIEMLVMDDGWFGNRYDDNRALGDWFVNEEKIKGGLKYLVDEVNKLGMKFGIWFEPEMISPDSDLYREHPDWAIAIPGRTAGLCRNQYVLDITRDEIRDYIVERVCDILSSANIEYVKWDMNRQLADLGSKNLPFDRMGELSHRYTLAVYDMQERILERFPDLLLENCSGGGARFDPGMLYYSPQIWCSDDTDAIERLKIQEGTALLYPLSTMGAHVSVCPNHTVGRNTPFETRGYVALAGTFGYELDVTKLSDEDKAMIPGQCKMYHKYRDLVTMGDYYRIASYAENGYFDAYMTVSKDMRESLLTFVQVMNRPNVHSRIIRLKGLDPDAKYLIQKFNMETGEDEVYLSYMDKPLSGETLMSGGIVIENLWGDNRGLLLHVVKA